MFKGIRERMKTSGRFSTTVNNEVILDRASFGENTDLKLYANSLLDNGEVHYLDLSDDSQKFKFLLPNCFLYSDELQLSHFLKDLHLDLSNRCSDYREGKSLSTYPLRYIVVASLINEDHRKDLRDVIRPFLSLNRIIKYAFITKDMPL